MKGIAQRLMADGLDHFSIVPKTCTSGLALKLYIAKPVRAEVKRIVEGEKAITPFHRKFFSKQFWKSRPIMNPLRKAFWKIKTRKEIVRNIEPTGFEGVDHQRIRATLAVGNMQTILSKIPYVGKHMMVSMKSVPTGTNYGPAYVVINGLTPLGLSMVRGVVDDLRKRKVKELPAKISAKRAKEDIFGKDRSVHPNEAER
ncbi:MAG: hypothetical protein ABH863_05675 [Candidatus Micrarchaeota archaeon]